MLTVKEQNEALESLELYAKDLEFLSRKSRDLVFIAGALSAGAILGVIALNQLVIASWIFTNILMIYVCVKMWEYHAEQRRIHSKIRRIAQKLLINGDLSEKTNEKVAELLYLDEYKENRDRVIMGVV